MAHVVQQPLSSNDPVPDILPEDNGDSEDDLDDDPDIDSIIASEAPDHLTAHDEPIRRKFLNCVAELLAHTKGGKHVTATALREKENSVEVDVAKNTPFSVEDDKWLASLSHFLAKGGGGRGTTAADGTIYDLEDSCPSLLEAIARRNAARLDGWIEQFAKLLKGTRLVFAATRPVGAARSVIPGQEDQLSVREAAEEFIKWIRVSILAPATGESAAMARLRMVWLAAMVARSPEAASTELKRIAPFVDGSKAARLCRLIARPAVNLRILARIAHLIPSFQTVVFIKIQTPRFTRLSPQQITGLAEAWKQLGLPPLDPLPPSLSCRQSCFQKDCVRAFPVHCEAQLLLRLHPRSTRPPVGRSRGSQMCIMCQSDAGGSGKCSGCLSVWYCSRQCKSADWPAHQLLYSSYLVFIQSWPSRPHKLDIWFPKHTERPALIWVPMITKRKPGAPDRYYPNLGSFLGPERGALDAITIIRNQRRGVGVGHDISVYYRRGDTLPNKSLRRAVEACHGMTVPGETGGSGQLVAIAGRATTSPSAAADITLSDFRHVLDLFSTRGDSTVRETPTGGSIRAVRISYELEQRLYGHDVFCAVSVQGDLPFAHEQSLLSDRLGVPLRVCKPRLTDLESAESGGGGLRNAYATALTTDMDASSGGWGKSRSVFEGGTIIARSDRADLDLVSAIRVCRYCVEVLQPLFKRVLAGEIERDDALKEVSPQKLAAWAPSAVECGGGFVQPELDPALVDGMVLET
ncbi:hypothetical protein B0H67DRAFT_609555 [Lasiosphaeris hirsuta]|uniref:MYND-type domain-containing protein n=1 Tax=Lasiosphaeris hirsuta TaxID=260670 RepID=A0AA40ASA4_9PEZI|nr:hypothetical protein B0H67DRAFT_609555 [Lasiosphaeris hirsuta]